MPHVFLVKCKRCNHNQKYQTNTSLLTNKKKKCVYCGYTFSVKERIVKQE